MKTIYDLFFKKGYECTLCGAFRQSENAIRDHVRSFHGDKARELAQDIANSEGDIAE